MLTGFPLSQRLKNIYQSTSCPTQITSLLAVPIPVFFCLCYDIAWHGMAWHSNLQRMTYSTIYIRLLWICSMFNVHLYDIHLPCKHGTFVFSPFFHAESSWKRRLMAENKQCGRSSVCMRKCSWFLLHNSIQMNESTNQLTNDVMMQRVQ